MQQHECNKHNYLFISGCYNPRGPDGLQASGVLAPAVGSSSVYKYNKKFNHLSQYGSYHVDTDEKKMSLFRQGLSPVSREHLTLFWGCALNELMSTSIEQEDACRARLGEGRKKRPLPGPNKGALPKYRLVYTPPLGQLPGPPPSQQWSHRPPQQVAPCPPIYPRLNTPPRAPQPAGGRVSMLQLWSDWALLP
jgi:hypothetical protein